MLGVTIFLLVVLLFAFATPASSCSPSVPFSPTPTHAGQSGLLDSLLALPRSLAETSSLQVLLLCAAIVTNGGVLWYRALTSNDGRHSLLAYLRLASSWSFPFWSWRPRCFESSEQAQPMTCVDTLKGR